jgi:hypothetical protein
MEQYLWEFSETSGDDIQNLHHRLSAPPRGMWGRGNPDISFYEVSSDENDRRAFEYAMVNYAKCV